MKTILSLIISGALVVSGYAQTRNVLVGTNNAVVQPTNFWSADASNARTGLSLGSAATNDASAFQPASLSLSNLSSSNGGALTNLQATNLVGLISTSNIPPILLTNIGTITIAQGGTSATNAANARQNLGSTTIGDALFIATNAASARTALGATTVGNSVFTAVDAAAARTALSLGTASTNPASAFQPSSTVLSNLASSNAVNLTNLQATNIVGTIPSSNIPSTTLTNITGTLAIASGGTGATNSAAARTNLGLEWSALTNTNTSGFNASLYGSNTNPVLVNTNGEVVSPTNFWQVAPITTTFIESQPTTNFTTNITPARFLHIHSLATNIVNVTNTIVLPTNTLTFEGDVAIVVHKGPTNSMTRVQRAGSTNNLITLTRFDEAVQFVYYNDVWQFDHNVAFVEPIYFSGTNAAANAAVSRTNLGLGAGNIVSFSGLYLSSFLQFVEGSGTTVGGSNGLGLYSQLVFKTNVIETYMPFQFLTNFNNSAAITRTNLGLGASWLTNTNVTNFRTAIGLGATNDVEFLTVDTDVLRWEGAEVFELETFTFYGGLSFNNPTNAAITRTNLGLGATNNVTFSRVTSSNGFNIFDGGSSGWIASGGITSFNLSYFFGSFTSSVVSVSSAGDLSLNTGVGALTFSTNNTNGAAITRTNLGLGATNAVTFSALTLSSDLTLGSGDNIVLSTTTGTKIGTATNQLLGFYNQTPITQPSSTGVTTNGFIGGGGGATVHPQSTFTGGIGTNAYTISDIVAHLKSLGLIAQ